MNRKEKNRHNQEARLMKENMLAKFEEGRIEKRYRHKKAKKRSFKEKIKFMKERFNLK